MSWGGGARSSGSSQCALNGLRGGRGAHWLEPVERALNGLRGGRGAHWLEPVERALYGLRGRRGAHWLEPVERALNGLRGRRGAHWLEPLERALHGLRGGRGAHWLKPVERALNGLRGGRGGALAGATRTRPVRRSRLATTLGPRNQSMSHPNQLPEQLARDRIDAGLRQAGWVVQAMGRLICMRGPGLLCASTRRIRGRRTICCSSMGRPPG